MHDIPDITIEYHEADDVHFTPHENIAAGIIGGFAAQGIARLAIAGLEAKGVVDLSLWEEQAVYWPVGVIGGLITRGVAQRVRRES